MAETFLPPSWLNDQDAETIHKRMMEQLPADIDNTEGGFPWDFTMPTALEKAEMLEFHLAETLKIMFPQWSYGDWLRQHAAQRGIHPLNATVAYGVLKVDGLEGTIIPKGYVFGVPAVGDTAAIGFAALEDCVIEVYPEEPPEEEGGKEPPEGTGESGMSENSPDAAQEAGEPGGDLDPEPGTEPNPEPNPDPNPDPGSEPEPGDEEDDEEEVEEEYFGPGTYARVKVLAVEPGRRGNVPANSVTIMLSKPLVGILSVTNPSELDGGTEAEDDKALRERILELDRAGDTSFAGNNADYIRWAKEVDGIGSAYVVPQWDPNVPNSVKVVLLDKNGKSANARLIKAVEKHILSPEEPLNRKVPIGAIVTVAAPINITIDYAFTLSLEDDALDLPQILEKFQAKLQTYYMTAKDERMVRYSVIGGLLIGLSGVMDYSGLTINGGTENIDIAEAEYPITGRLDALVT